MWLQCEVVEQKAGEFGHTQAGREAQMKHGAIADAGPVDWLRGV